MNSLTWNLPIAGMTCASCVSRVEKALKNVSGVQQAEVNLATESARVQTDAQTGMPALREAVVKAGYSLREQQLTLQISGMTCASCVGRVEKAFLKVPGVLKAAVNLATESASVEALADVEPATLIAAVTRAGYQASLAGDAPRAKPDWQHSGWPVLIAAGLSAPMVLPMLGLLFGRHWMIDGWWQLALTLPVQFWLGARFYKAGWKARCAPVPATWTCWSPWAPARAYGLSLYQLLFKSRLSHAHAAPVLSKLRPRSIITLVLLGKWLEARAKRQTTAAIRRSQCAASPRWRGCAVPYGRMWRYRWRMLKLGDVGGRPPGRAHSGGRRVDHHRLQPGGRIADHGREPAGGQTRRATR